MTIDELLVRVSGSTAGLQSLPSEVNRVLNRVQTTAARTMAGIPGGSGMHFDRTVDRWRESTGRFTASAERSTGALGRMGNVMDGLTRSATALTAGLSIPIYLMGTRAIRAAVELDTLKRGLRAVAVEGENTEHTFLRLREVARLPGLGLSEAVQGAVNLRAAGLSAAFAERSLKAFGNAIATTGGGAPELQRVVTQLSQMSSASKLLTQDLRPILQTAPLVATAMREAFGTINAEDIVAQGISTEEFLERLVAQLEELPQMSSGPKVALENITDALFLMGATIGNAVLPIIERFVAVAEPMIEKVAAAFEALPPSVQLGGVAFAAMLAAAGPLLLLFSSLTPAILGVIAGAAALAAIGVQVAQAAQEMGDGFASKFAPAVELAQQVMADLQRAAGTVMDELQSVIGSALETVSAWWDEHGASVMDKASEMWSQLVQVGAETYETLKSIVLLATTYLGGIWDKYGATLMAITSTLWDTIVAVTRTALGIVRGVVEFFTNALTGNWRGAFAAIGDITVSVMRGVGQVFLRGVNVILHGVQLLLNALPVIGKAAAGAVQTAIDAIDGVADRIGAGSGDIHLPVVADVYVPPGAADAIASDVGGIQLAPTERPGGPSAPSSDGSGRERALTDAEKRAKKITETLAQLPRDLAAAAAKGTLFSDALGAAEERAQILQRTATRLIELGLDPADARLNDIARQWGNAADAAKELQRQADITEVLSDATDGLARVNAEAQVFGDLMGVPADEVAVIERAITGLLENGLEPSSAQVQHLVRELELAREAAQAVERVMAQVAAQDAANAQRRQASAQFGLDGDVYSYAASQAQAYQQQLDNLLASEGGFNQATAEALQSRVDGFTRMAEVAGIAQQAMGQLQGSIIGFGQDAAKAFGMALAGQQSLAAGLAQAIGGVLSGVFDTLGNMLIQVGVTALGVGKGIAAIVASLSTMNPLLAIGAGVALVALGAAVKAGLANIAGGGGSSFGGGGGRSGYELGAVGAATRSAADPDNPAQATIDEIKGLRRDVRELRNRPIQFTGDPREVRRSNSAAEQQDRRTSVRS